MNDSRLARRSNIKQRQHDVHQLYLQKERVDHLRSGAQVMDDDDLPRDVGPSAYEIQIEHQVRDLLNDASISSWRRKQIEKVLQGSTTSVPGQRLRQLLAWSQYLSSSVGDNDMPQSRRGSTSRRGLRSKSPPNKSFSRMRSFDSSGQFAAPAINLPPQDGFAFASERRGEMGFVASRSLAGSDRCYIHNNFG